MSAAAYQWKTGSRIGLDAQLAGERIEAIRQKANGLLTPALVVDEARDSRSVLHAAFEWNDSVAAEKHREDQARYLIRSLVVQAETKTDIQSEVRAFVSVSRNDGTEPGYTSLAVAMSDTQLRAQVLERAWAELESWRSRYEAYTEIAAWFEAAKSTRKRQKTTAAL